MAVRHGQQGRYLYELNNILRVNEQTIADGLTVVSEAAQDLTVIWR